MIAKRTPYSEGEWGNKEFRPIKARNAEKGGEKKLTNSVSIQDDERSGRNGHPTRRERRFVSVRAVEYWQK